MRSTLAVILCIICAGCLHLPSIPTMQSEGLTPEILFKLEAEEWGPDQPFPDAKDWWSIMAGYKQVPLSARPTAIKNIICRWEKDLDLFHCSYDVDWKSAEGRTGTWKRQSVHLSRTNGIWNNDTIVLS